MKKNVFFVFTFIFFVSSLNVGVLAATNDLGYESRVNNLAREKEERIQKVFDERARLLLENPENFEVESLKLDRKLRALGVAYKNDESNEGNN